ncbi:hypothetical protein PENTCL1PPCAC_25548, partial [Pristionchus entomophagus]
ETNEDGVTSPDRPRMDELSPHEKLMDLFAKYKTNTSYLDRCHALEKLRSHIAIFWDEIFSTQSIEFKSRFLKDLLQVWLSHITSGLR